MSADDTQNNAINLDSRAPTRENKAHKTFVKITNLKILKLQKQQNLHENDV